MAQGLAFKITKKGWLAVEWIHGRRTRVHPEGDSHHDPKS